MPVLSTTEIANLKNYKYRGSDNSLLYHYLLSPLAQAIADVMPDWVAPNVITLVGLLFSLLSFSLTLSFNPSFGSDAPRWLSLVAAFCLFMYQTLDNVDGKQARRTKTSSPLGMLFDHGCDAINATVSAVKFNSFPYSIFFLNFSLMTMSLMSKVPMCSVFGTGRTMAVFLCFTAAYWPFYLQVSCFISIP